MIITSDFTISPPVLSGVRVAQSLVFCVVFCMVLFSLSAVVLSVLLQLTVSDYTFWYLFIKHVIKLYIGVIHY